MTKCELRPDQVWALTKSWSCGLSIVWTQCKFHSKLKQKSITCCAFGFVISTSEMLKMHQKQCWPELRPSPHWRTVQHFHRHTHTHTHTTVLLLFWNMAGTTQVSRYQKGKTRKVKANLDLMELEIVGGSGICYMLYATLTPFDLLQGLPLRGATWVHLIHRSTHPQSSSLHGTVKAGSLSKIEKRALPGS